MDDRWCADQLDMLRAQVGGKLDSSTAGDGGERDAWRMVPLRDRQRLQGAGLVGRGGWAPDQACDEYNAARGTDLDVCSFVERWSSEVLAVLDSRAAIRSGRVESADRPTDDEPTLPAWATAWLGRLVNDRKREYATAIVWAQYGGLAMPADPGAPWAEQVQRKVMNRWNAAVARGEIVEEV